MPANVVFRGYTTGDKDECLRIFDANCPEYFAPNERVDYQGFLDAGPPGYEVCLAAGKVVGAFGLTDDGASALRLSWILLDPAVHGVGIGSAIMERVAAVARGSAAGLILIAASHRSAPFFARFGAREVLVTMDGWGLGMHRHDMELRLG